MSARSATSKSIPGSGGHPWLPAVAPAAALGLIPLAPGHALAHGFGQRYDLPVPLWLWVTGGAAAVILSFVVVGAFVRGTPGLRGYPRINLLRPGLARPAAWLAAVAQMMAVALLGLVIAAGALGDQNPTRNFAPTMVWIVWWVGLAYVSALVGNVWAVVNPWAALFRWAETLVGTLDPGGKLAADMPYPSRLDRWPGVILFLIFAWIELVFPGRAVPGYLALTIVVYSAITLMGMSVFGRHVWLRYADPFALAFGLLARFSPTEVRVTDSAVCRDCPLDCRDADGDCVDCYACFEAAPPAFRELNLRPFGAGLLVNVPVSLAMVVFTIVMLSTVTFDGFMATPVWGRIESDFYSAALRNLDVVRTLGLLGFAALLLEVYQRFAAWMARAAGGECPAETVARTFVLSLVPIAIAYHLAHYFTFLLIQGQMVIPLAADTFGYGWNLFGMASYRPDIGLVGARFAWYTAVIAIVLGHVIAVYVAHVLALRLFGDPGRALRSQYPMLVMMVGYTMLSLWIVAQPIVETTP